MADWLPVTLRALARGDVGNAVEWYRDHAGADVALALVDALEAALSQVGLYPRTGSSRYGDELRLPGLRSWRLDGFPYLVFYVERTGHVDVWRVLHAHRDIPASISGGDQSATEPE